MTLTIVHGRSNAVLSLQSRGNRHTVRKRQLMSECVDRWRRCNTVSCSRQKSHDTPHAPASHVAHHMSHTSTESSLFTAFGLTDLPGPPTLPKRIHLVPSPSNFKPAAAAAAAAAAVDSSCNSSATSKSQILGLINKRHNALMNQIIT